jgi:hypothetical protein
MRIRVPVRVRGFSCQHVLVRQRVPSRGRSHNPWFNLERKAKERPEFVLDFLGELSDVGTTRRTMIDQDQGMCVMHTGIAMAYAFPSSPFNQPGGRQFHQ